MSNEFQKDFKDECVRLGVVKHDHGVEVCGLNKAKRCWAHSCPSYHYPTKPPVSRHKSKALAKVGISEAQYEEEMGIENR